MKTLSILILSLTLLALGVGASACNRSDRVEAARETDSVDNRSNVLSDDEKEFTDYAAEMHVGEIDLAQLAKQKSTNENVKNYADEVISGHSDALKRLSDRTGQNRTRETTVGSLDTKYHAKYLAPLSGAQFDQEFIALMIADHKDAAQTFQAQLNAAQNRELKKYLKDTLPTLENGLSNAEKVREKLTATTNQ
ncbi:MAG TPA: DUF4142 domain-containing protein [Terriglobia bacterium]|nr:DUF4142 domain-containing protein [Terriglobia bacterium]